MSRSISRHVHVIPVDPSLSIREQWAEICNFGRRVTYTGPQTWAAVGCGGQECERVEVNDAG